MAHCPDASSAPPSAAVHGHTADVRVKTSSSASPAVRVGSSRSILGGVAAPPQGARPPARPPARARHRVQDRAQGRPPTLLPTAPSSLARRADRFSQRFRRSAGGPPGPGARRCCDGHRPSRSSRRHSRRHRRHARAHGECGCSGGRRYRGHARTAGPSAWLKVIRPLTRQRLGRRTQYATSSPPR